MGAAEHPALLIAEQIGALRLLTINRPDKLNAFTPAVIAQLHAALDDALADDDTRMVAITGAGQKAFAAGNDIDGLNTLDPVSAYRDMVAGQQLMLRLHDFPKPTLAMVNGYALGGGFELALSCDFIIAASTARFGFPEITLNTLPGWGGTQLAVKRMGLSRAKQMVLGGQHHSAQECDSFGILQQVVAPEELRARSIAFCEVITRHSGFALEMAKRAMNRAVELPLGTGMELEAANYGVNFGTAEARAGLNAFLTRRSTRAHSAKETSQHQVKA